jgi:hypothetical protein
VKGPKAAKRARPARAALAAASAEPGLSPEMQHVFKVFDEQIDAAWQRLTHECQQFAEGFNQETGTPQIHVEPGPELMIVRFTPTSSEVGFQLDKHSRRLECLLSSEGGYMGSSIMEQPPIGIAIENDKLLFLYGNETMSEEDLAVKVLTELVEFQSQPASTTSASSTRSS